MPSEAHCQADRGINAEFFRKILDRSVTILLDKNKATYVKRPDGSSTIKRKVLKNLGALEKWDDGKPDFLERLRTQFKNGELHIDDLDERTPAK